MADIQFTIKESLAPHQANLAIPVFTKGKSQLDPISVKKKGELPMCIQSTLPNDYMMSAR